MKKRIKMEIGFLQETARSQDGTVARVHADAADPLCHRTRNRGFSAYLIRR